MRIKSIRTRLTVWYTGLLTVTLIVLAGSAYWLLVYSLAQDVDASLEGVAKISVERARESSGSFFPPDVDDIFRRFFGFSPTDRYFEMLDPMGRRDPRRSLPHSAGKLPLTPKAIQNASQGRSTLETLEGLGRYPVRVLTVPVVRSGRIVNIVQVGMSLESMHRTQRRFLFSAVLVLPIALLLAGGGGWLLARRALGPVGNMTTAANRIRAEALSERLEETGTGDELDRLAKTLNRMIAHLETAFQQIRRFSADASHELQTPLTILKGELEVALRSERRPEEYQRVLKSALDEIDKMAQLVDGLLVLARGDVGVLRMDLKPVDLAQLAEAVYHQAKVLADAGNVTLLLDIPGPVSIRGDDERLRRLVLNLVDNGIKYTAAGGEVVMSLHEEQEWVSIRIADTGIGIPDGEQEQVFQPFYRADEARSYREDGVGLGLSIANSIAQAHGGKIDLESAPGRGSVFTVLLPK